MLKLFTKNLLGRGVSTYVVLISLGLVLFSYDTALAQATNASISGTVKDEKGAELPGATVIVKNGSTGFETGTVTNLKGEFLLKQLPLGGPYTITVSFVGFGERKYSGYTLNQGDRINLEAELSESASQLDEVVVEGTSLQYSVEGKFTGTSITSSQLNNLATEGRSFSRLVSLSPLQGGGSINLAGQRRTSTNITLDGVNARNTLTAGEIGRGTYTVSQEAIREFEVVTNEYDVTIGRQGGGAINVVTKSGTNEVKGTAFFFHRNDALQSQFDIRGNDRIVDFSTSQYGFSVSGPIIKDKLHFFVAAEQEDSTTPVFIADINGPEDENRIGITQGNLDRVVQIARDVYGMTDPTPFGQFERETLAQTIFARFDLQLNDKHTLTLRNNYTFWDRPFSVFDNSSIELREAVGDFTSNENSLLLSLRSSISPKLTNELKFQYQRAQREFLPSTLLGNVGPTANIPRAIVNVQSDLPDGRSRTLTVQIGGQRFIPETNLENHFQLTNTAYLTAGKFNFTFGTDNTINFLETLLTSEQNGRFFFNSLDDFENQNPSRYAREVPLQGLPIVKQTVIDLSLFAQAEFNPHPHLNTKFGLRWDATAFLDAAEFNPVVFQELGIRTDEKPSDWDNIQPRFQLTWNVKGNNRDYVKLGGGIFSAQPHYYAQVNNIQNSGQLLGAIDISGDNVPTPDFPSYRNDPSTTPGVELIDQLGLEPFSTINAVSPGWEVPTIMKANANYTRFFGEKYSLGINVTASRTVNNYVYQEANLVNEPFFTEPITGRPVFVPASTIPASGNTDWTQSRISDRVGRTLVLDDDGILNQVAVTVEGTAQIGKDGYVNASFTWNRARDNSSYNCCVANTSTFLPVEGDPRDLNFGFSDNHFDTKLVVNGATPSWKGFVVGLTITGTGGERFSLHTDDNTSVNGDFNLRNDIAYIYDPFDPETPADIAEAYLSILDDPDVPENFKTYLEDNFGRYAERNGGKDVFWATADMRIQKTFKLAEGHGITLSADLFNLANFYSDVIRRGLLDNEFSQDAVWGKRINYSRREDWNRVTGFDPDTNTFSYRVQTGNANPGISGTPWRLQLGVRYNFGQ
ncbi:MAG: carboxypeptidase-like regulatory domain-containing protein [Bacteroidota bacterium]